jgi:hypothetical protein
MTNNAGLNFAWYGLLVFGLYWGLNSGSCICKGDALLLEPYPHAWASRHHLSAAKPGNLPENQKFPQNPASGTINQVFLGVQTKLSLMSIISSCRNLLFLVWECRFLGHYGH